MLLVHASTRAGRVARATVQTIGQVSCIGILVATSAFNGLLTFVARTSVRIISFVTGAIIDQDMLTPHRERYLTFQQPSQADHDASQTHPLLSYKAGTGGNGQPDREPFIVLDEEGTLQKVIEHYKEKEPNLPTHFGNEGLLTDLATRFISFEFGCLDTSLLAEDFQFVFPVVGPLTKDEFVEAFSGFKVRDAFPNSQSNFYNFKVDPLEPNRIWALSRGSFVHENKKTFLTVKPARLGRGELPRKVNLPPQCFSFSFDAEGKCYKMTGGYCVDRAVGDTDGLGGIFGVLHALGGSALPFPEGRPWGKKTRSLNWEAITLRGPQIVKDWKRVFAPLDDESAGYRKT